MTGHEELIARLEAATGPDRELDARIIHALWDSERDLMALVDEWDGDWGVVAFELAKYIPCFEHNSTRLTGSIDAALTLLIPGTLWGIGEMEMGVFCNLVWPQPDGDYVGGGIEAKSATPAIALCVAALRARSHD